MGGIIKTAWIFGAEVAAPADAAQLQKIIPSPNKLGLIFGYSLSCQEAAAAGKLIRLRANIGGTAAALLSADAAANLPPLVSESPLAVLKGNGTDFFEIVKVGASTASTLYRSGLLYAEIDIPDDFYRKLMAKE